MAKSLNTIQIIGNVGGDPTIRTTQGGKKVASVSVATSESWEGGERTDWHRVTFWGKMADIVEQYVKKGDRIYVAGSMRYGEYEKDGTKIPTAEINARDMIMLGGKSEGRTATAHADPGDPAQPSDDLPF